MTSTRVYLDRRPLLIQAIPYILAFSVFFVLVGMFSRRLPDSAVLPLRIFILFWFVVGLWSFNFIYKNGMLYVSYYLISSQVSSLLMETGELAETNPAAVGY
jgi:hypothetical protein